MRGGGGRREVFGQTPTLSNCYCCLTSPFIARKSIVKILAFVSLGGFS